MHELTIAENLIQLVEETARRESAQSVSIVVVEIGELSAIETDALSFAFDIVKGGGVAAAATLEIVPIPGVGQCQSCRTRMPMPKPYAECPACGSLEVEPVEGREMRIREIRIELGNAS